METEDAFVVSLLARYQQLSERERDVLVLVAGGYSASEIGEKLFISPKTVETHKQRREASSRRTVPARCPARTRCRRPR